MSPQTAHERKLPVHLLLLSEAPNKDHPVRRGCRSDNFQQQKVSERLTQAEEEVEAAPDREEVANTGAIILILPTCQK